MKFIHCGSYNFTQTVPEEASTSFFLSFIVDKLIDNKSKEFKDFIKYIEAYDSELRPLDKSKSNPTPAIT